MNYAKRSKDKLFESAARTCGKHLIGIILTGANHDERQGLKTIKEAGGIAIVQDPATAEVSEMSQAALNATDVDHVLPLEWIGFF